MPYSSVSDLPANVKSKLSPKKRRQWLAVWNSSYSEHKDESRAFASAWSSVRKAATMTDSFNFFLPITKIDKEKRTISGYCSTPAKDLDGEVVSLDALKAALPGYWEWRNIRRMHSQDAVGVGQEINIDDKGAYLTAKIVDDDTWNKCVEKVYKGFSIGGRKLAKSGDTITKIDWIETSVVDRPANPECSFTVNKRAKDGGAAYLVKPRRPPVERALTKMAQAVETLVEERADLVEKREFSSKQRERAASSGAALPDGSFPIENKSDLDNARQAIGRAKDKAKARAHIVARAKDLGVKLPDNWTKKSAKKLLKAAEDEKAKKSVDVSRDNSVTAKSASLTAPAFLTLDAGGGVEAVRGGVESGHELNLTGRDSFLSLEAGRSQQLNLELEDFRLVKREKKLLKRMSVAGQLSYCFDSIRDAQRSLVSEGVAEGGDMKDKGLATRLGVVAQTLAAIIGQKAEHEGQEALDLSDAGDRYLRSTLDDGELAMSAEVTKGVTLEQFLKGLAATGPLAKRGPTRADHFAQAKAEMKKAKDSRKEAAKCIKSAHGLMKSVYLAKDALAKAGKKKPPVDDNDADDMQMMSKVMGELQKAYGALEMNKTFVKSAGESFAKAAGRIGGAGTVEDGSGDYQVPAGVKSLTQSELVNDGGTPLQYRLDGPPIETSKGAAMVSKSEAEAMAKTAALEAENKLLRAMPAQGGPRPAVFDLNKVSGANKPATGDILEGIDAAAFQSPNEDVRNNAMSKMVGNFIMKTPGRSVFDPAFHGTAGAGNVQQ